MRGSLPRMFYTTRQSHVSQPHSTADIFDAITATRPYRAAVPIPRTLEIMAESVGTALDPDCFAALGRAVKTLEPAEVAVRSGPPVRAPSGPLQT